MRKIIDEYLDGMLDAAERADLERRMANDSALQALLISVKQERALRAAALASFEPMCEEAAVLAEKVLAETRGPVTLGYVGVWVKRIVGVAAVLALIAGSFFMGRTTATKTAVATAQADIRVIYLDDSGNKQWVEFNSLDEANAFIDRQHGLSQVAQNEVDLSRPGSI